jgi:hypothetical protein
VDGSQGAIRVYLIWLPNPGGKTLKSYYDDWRVYPSHINSEARTPDCGVRVESPRAFTYEECMLFKHPTQNIYFAYPVVGGEPFLMPGVYSPYEVIWRENAKRQGVSGMIYHDRTPTYFRILCGASNTKDQQSPNPSLSGNWSSEEPLKDGDVRLCWIGWQLTDTGNIVGYAYPAVQSDEAEKATDAVMIDVEARRGVVQVENHILILGGDQRARVSARKQGDHVVIVISGGTRNNGTNGSKVLAPGVLDLACADGVSFAPLG